MGVTKMADKVDGTGRGGPKDSTYETAVAGTAPQGGEKGGDRTDTGPNPGSGGGKMPGGGKK